MIGEVNTEKKNIETLHTVLNEPWDPHNISDQYIIL